MTDGAQRDGQEFSPAPAPQRTYGGRSPFRARRPKQLLDVTHIDSTGLEALEDLRRDRITLVVAHLQTRLYTQLERAGVADTIGPGRFYPTVRGAVDACSNAHPR